MLGKLIKYELKHTSKMMFVTFAALAIATMFGAFALRRLEQGGTDSSSLFGVVMLILYIVAVIGIFCIDFIYLCDHYYKTMYSAQGYLTHTLPVSPTANFSAKILVFLIWMLIASVLSVFSMLLLIQVVSGGVFFQELSSLSLDSQAYSALDIFGIPAGLLLFFFFIDALLGILWYILFVTASMAIGQLFQKGRTGFSILAGFCLYILNKLINTIYLAVTGYNTLLLLSRSRRDFIRHIMVGDILLSAAFVVLLYGICIYINKKKLNLE